MISTLLGIAYAGLLLWPSHALFAHGTGCSSPETKRSSSESYAAGCEFGDSILSNPHLADIVDQLRRLKKEECAEFVIYSASLGSSFSAFIAVNESDPGARRDSEHGAYGQCFFSFVLGYKTEISTEGSEVVISLLPAHLPYKNMRRNVKILKFLGLCMSHLFALRRSGSRSQGRVCVWTLHAPNLVLLWWQESKYSIGQSALFGRMRNLGATVASRLWTP
jgi:hypothetical protein